MLILACSSMSLATQSILFYDDFDDGDISDWTATHPGTGDPVLAPDIVPSPEGYSLRGVGSGYFPTDDPGLSVFISQPLSLSNVGELTIGFRAKSGPQWPNQANLYLKSGSDYYAVRDYGEQGANEKADLTCYVDGSEHVERLHIGSRAFEWHDFAWSRDADGWWSLSIDGTVEWANFYQDNSLTDFDQITLHILRNQSEIESVYISGNVISTTVAIDIKPESYPNPINLGSYGLTPVAIFSDIGFDATAVDPATINLAGAGVALRGNGKYMAHEEDVDADGLVDLVVQIVTCEIDPSALEEDGDLVYAILTGQTSDGEMIEGSDEIVIVPSEE